MERAIGEVFELDGVKLRVDEAEYWCEGCYLYDNHEDCTDVSELRGGCGYYSRSDKQNVIFTEVK